MHELEEAQVERQLLLRDAPMRSQPGPKQRPESLQAVHVNLAKPITVLVTSEFPGRMADGAMRVAPGRQFAVDVILVGIDHAPGADRSLDDRADGRLLDVLQHADDDLPRPLDHAQDRRLLLLKGPPTPLPLEAPPPTQALLPSDGFGMALMPGHDIDLVAFDFTFENDRGLVIDDALPQLRAHALGIVRIEVQLAGDLLIGEVQPQEIQTEDPDPQGLMMAGEDGPGEVVEAARTATAEIAPTSVLRLVVALLGNLVGITVGASDPLRPPQVADDLEAARVVDQGLDVEHS